jgi:hypothetical protein
MKTLICTVIVMLSTFTNNLLAQDGYKVTEGLEIKLKKTSIWETIGTEEGALFLIKWVKRDMFLEKTDLNQQTLALVPLKYKDVYKDLTISYTGGFLMSNYLYLLYSSSDKINKEYIYYLKAFDKNTLAQIGEIKEVMRSPMSDKKVVMMSPLTDPQYMADFMSSYNRKLVYVSEDKTKFLIYINVNLVEKDEPEKLKLAVFDNDLNKIWQKEFELPFPNQKFTVASVKLNNQSDVYMTGIYSMSGKEASASRREKKPDYAYHLLSFKDKGESFKDNVIALEGEFITDLLMEINTSGNPVIAGFYSNKDGFDFKGTFYLTFDSTTSAVQIQKQTEFDKKFIQENMSPQEIKRSEHEDKKGKLEMPNYNLKKLFINENGRITLVAEQFFITTSTQQNANGQSVTVQVYHYHDILLINFDETGTVLWKTKIPKRQALGQDYSSFSSILKDNKMYIIFNDNPENLELPTDGVAKDASTKGYGLMVIEVDADNGNTKRSLALIKNKSQPIPCPATAINSESNYIIFQAKPQQASSLFQFIKISFNE